MLDYLGVAEVIDTMEDLVQFLRDISPALSRAAREVSKWTIILVTLALMTFLMRDSDRDSLTRARVGHQN